MAFKTTVGNFSVQIGLLGSIKVAFECQNPNFGSFDIQMCELLFLATIAAFLAFMALKLQNTVFPNLLTPNGPNNMEKSLTFHIFDPVAFRLTITTSVALF